MMVTLLTPSPSPLGHSLYIKSRDFKQVMRAVRSDIQARPGLNDRRSRIVQPALLALVIPALSQRVRTVDDFQTQAGFASKRTAKLVLEYLLRRGIGRVSPFGYSFSKADRIK